MIPTVYDLRAFYKSFGGRIVRRLVREKLLAFWPDAKSLRLLGGGYALPYLRPYREGGSERTIAVMFKGQGVHHWPEENGALNLACLADETDLPFETNSVDRIILIHSLEFTGYLKPAFEEFWRVLKSNGRILIVVPNRIGFWSRAEWTPFGRGAPYSAAQVEEFLRENLFIPERTERGLFIPPFKSQTLLRSANFWEKIGPYLFPAMGGLLFVEGSKQIYAGTGKRIAVGKGKSKLIPARAPEFPEPASNAPHHRKKF
ncbi:MAG: class I SAM-dependent methyltransferase [Micavibrio sp.]